MVGEKKAHILFFWDSSIFILLSSIPSSENEKFSARSRDFVQAIKILFQVEIDLLV
jgi:hypothetical protein